MFTLGGDASIFPKSRQGSPVVSPTQDRKRKFVPGLNEDEGNQQHFKAKRPAGDTVNEEKQDWNDEKFNLTTNSNWKEDKAAVSVKTEDNVLINKTISSDMDSNIKQNDDDENFTHIRHSHNQNNSIIVPEGDFEAMNSSGSLDARNKTDTFANEIRTGISSFTVGQEQVDIFRTGAKCVPNGAQDPLKSGSNYHVIGALRIKPGRGFRTNSMSCSDKLLKWRTLGLQGGLLSTLLERPVTLSTLVLSSPNFNVEAVKRALSFRGREIDELDGERFQEVTVLHAKSALFEDGRQCVEKKSKGENIFSSGVGMKLS